MTSVLHSAFQLSLHPGIAKQMIAEQAAANRLSLKWQCRLFTAEPCDEPICVTRHISYRNRFSARLAYYQWLYKLSHGFDIILLRHSLSDPLQVAFLLLVRKPVVLVHHTLEVPQIKTYKGRFTRIKVIVEKVCGRWSLGLSSALVCVTSEIERYEQSRLRQKKGLSHIYPNGLLESDNIKVIQKTNSLAVGPQEPIQIVFAASNFTEWHGLDKVIAAAEASTEDFILHVVGIIDSEDLHQRAIACSFISLYGPLTNDALEEVISQCDIGLGSFALERKGMREACPLKVRDYLSAGLPVYAGHPDIFPSDFAYYREGSCDFDEIVAFAKQAREIDKTKVSDAAHPYIDKTALVQKLFHFLDQNIVTECDVPHGKVIK